MPEPPTGPVGRAGEPARLVPPGRPGRPRVVLLTAHWGGGDDEATAATRLVAGALSRHAEVSVIHLDSPPGEIQTVSDSVFTVHRLPVHGARALRSGILRASLGARDGGERVPAVAEALLERYEGEAPDVAPLLERLAPRAVVLLGRQQPWDLSALGTRSQPGRPRVVAVPLLGDPRRLQHGSVREALARADIVGTVHPGERRAVLAAFPDRAPEEVPPIDLAFTVNRGATRHRLFGVRWFGRYVVSIRSFPPGGPRYVRSVTHEVLRSVLGNVSVAEVDDGTWRISDEENSLELPVSPSRVNLWRLMAHAMATIDLRPPGPVGREAIESMLLGTPVLVPEPSPAMEHAAAADGGLWYRDTGELFDAARVLLDRPLRDRLAEQGEAYAAAAHGRMDDFVTRIARLVLGD